MKWIEAGGISIATQAFGKAGDPAVVLVMGATASMLYWPEAMCTSLSERGLFVIRYDHRDTGGATTVPPGAATYSVEDMAGDMLAVMDGYGLERAHLVGMSLGGYIAQIAALEHPERVASLTLIASEPLGWDGHALPGISPAFNDHFAKFEAVDWTDAAAVEDFLLAGERLCAGSGAPFDEVGTRQRIRAELARTDSPASMFNHGSRTTEKIWTGQFREIGRPTLVIHGADDPILPLPNGEALAAGISGARLVVLPGVGHELPARAIPPMVDKIAGLVSES